MPKSVKTFNVKGPGKSYLQVLEIRNRYYMQFDFKL